jgi:hypothetical protein
MLNNKKLKLKDVITSSMSTIVDRTCCFFVCFFFSNEQRAATTRQGIMRMLNGYKEIPKTSSRQSTILDFKSSVETRASPLVLLDIGDDDPSNQPMTQEEVLPP